MLSYRTIEPNPLELLNKLSQLSILSDRESRVHPNRNFRLLINESTYLS